MDGILDDVTGFFKKEYTTASDYVSKQYSKANAYGTKEYNDLKNKVEYWAKTVKTLMNLKVPAHMQAEKNALLKRAISIKNVAEKIFGKIDSVSGLGFIPIVAWVTYAAIAGALTIITKWMIDYAAFAKKVTVYNSAIKNNATPQQAAAVSNEVARDTTAGDNPSIIASVKDITGTVKNYAPLIGVAIIVYVFKDKLFGGQRRGK